MRSIGAIIQYILYASVSGTLTTMGVLILTQFVNGKAARAFLWTFVAIQFLLPLFTGKLIDVHLLPRTIIDTSISSVASYRMYCLTLVKNTLFIVWAIGAIVSGGFHIYRNRSTRSLQAAVSIFILTIHWFNPAVTIAMRKWHQNWTKFGKSKKKHIDSRFLA